MNKHIGLAKRDITPPIGATLVGYRPRTSTAIDMPLFVSALYCSYENARWLLLCCDVLGISADYVARIRARIAEATQLNPQSIMLSVSHTHSGPMTMGSAATKAIDIDYIENFIANMIACGIEAVKNAQAGFFSFTQTASTGLSHNRRIEDPEKGWTNEWKDPNGEHPGYTDESIHIVGIHDADKQLRSVLINFACHPVTLGPGNLAISPDYVGYLKQKVCDLLNIDDCLFCLAGCANINPRDCINDESSSSQRMGHALAEIICTATSELVAMNNGNCHAHISAWEFERTQTCSKETGIVLTSEFQMLACDELSIIAVPGELFCEYNQMLRDRSPYPCTIIASISNDYIGYLPTDLGQEQGAYEAKAAPALQLEEMILAHCDKLLQMS